MRLRKRSGNASESHSDRPRYVSSLQKDVRKYAGWTRDQVEGDYRASKAVHTIVTIGYMEYVDDVLVLTDRGRMLMQNVSMVKASPADQRPGEGLPTGTVGMCFRDACLARSVEPGLLVERPVGPRLDGRVVDHLPGRPPVGAGVEGRPPAVRDLNDVVRL